MTKREICERLLEVWAMELYKRGEAVGELLLDLAAPCARLKAASAPVAIHSVGADVRDGLVDCGARGGKAWNEDLLTLDLSYDGESLARFHVGSIEPRRD